MDHKKICKEKENSSSLRENKLLYQSSYFAHEKKKNKTPEPFAKRNSTLKPVVITQNYFLLNSEPFKMVINQQI